MHLEDLLHIFFAFAIGQGLFMAFVFVGKARKESSSFIFLSGFLLIFSLILAFWIGFWRNLYNDYPYIGYLAGPMDLLLGPFIFFFIKSNTDYNFRFTPSVLVHLLPFILLLIFNLNTTFYLMNGNYIVDFFNSSFTLGFAYNSIIILKPIQIMCYAIWITLVALEKKAGWLNFFALTFIIYTLGGFLYAGMILFFQYSLLIDYVIALFIVLSIYSVSYSVIFYPNIFIRFKPSYERSSLSHDHEPEICEKILEHLYTSKAYLKPGYSQENLTLEMGLTKHHISQAINHHLKKSFNELINELRVENAKKLLKNSLLENPKMIAIAFDSGFNNKVSFYQHFKRLTGQSPKEFQETLV